VKVNTINVAKLIIKRLSLERVDRFLNKGSKLIIGGAAVDTCPTTVSQRHTAKQSSLCDTLNQIMSIELKIKGCVWKLL
jgi:hypothetical protein